MPAAIASPTTDPHEAPAAVGGGASTLVETQDDRILRDHAGAFAAIDALEVAMLSQAEYPVVDLPVEHRFTPGLYVRTIHMPAGTLLTSKIHRTEHPFVIHKGVVDVFDDDNGPMRLTAPHMGITLPGTRRVLRIVEDCVWSTFHPTGEMGVDLAGLTEAEKLDRIESAIILKHDEHRAGLVQPPTAPAIESSERGSK